MELGLKTRLWANFGACLTILSLIHGRNTGSLWHKAELTQGCFQFTGSFVAFSCHFCLLEV